MPRLNQARSLAGACFLGGNIYVFCGYNGQQLNSIEKLNVNAIASGKAAWQLIQPSLTELSPRIYFSVAAITSDKIAILGGQQKDNCLTQVGLFDTKTERCISVADKSLYKFNSFRNQTARVNSNTIISLVRSKADITTLIEYTTNIDSIKVLSYLTKEETGPSTMTTLQEARPTQSRFQF